MSPALQQRRFNWASPKKEDACRDFRNLICLLFSFSLSLAGKSFDGMKHTVFIIYLFVNLFMHVFIQLLLNACDL